MNSTLSRNTTNTDLLNRVRNDVSRLRGDVSELLAHTTQQTLPKGARELVGNAKHRLTEGGALALSHLKDFKHYPPRQSVAWVGSAIALGIVGYGLYSWLSKKQCAAGVQQEHQLELEDQSPLEI